MENQQYDTVILDLGGVLAFYTAQVDIAGISPSQVKNALDSPFWHDYERGNISKQDCHKAVTTSFNLDPESWSRALDQLMHCLQPNETLISAIKKLKQEYPKLKVYCMSNIPILEMSRLMDQINSWGIIDHFFASSTAKQRKPDAAFFEYVLRESEITVGSCIFVDDRVENVVAAQCLGFKAVLYEENHSVMTVLYNLLGDPVMRAQKFLEQHAKNLFCETDTGQKEADNYSQLLILEHAGNRELVILDCQGPTWNYSIGEPVAAEKFYPNDADTTSLACILLDDISSNDKRLAMEAILSYVSPDGLPYCWLSETRPRFCHCICANVFRFFYINGWSSKLPKVYDYLCRLLETKAYLHGSRYYTSPDWLLYVLSDLCARRPDDPQLHRIKDLLIVCIQDRIGCSSDVLGAALRLLSAQCFDIPDNRDLEIILDAQQLDGGWKLAWLWGYGKVPIKIGSRGVVTAMAMRAIQQARR